MPAHLLRRAAAAIGGAGLLLAAGAATADAHVTVSAPGAAPGGYAVLTFRVPTESATAATTGLRVQLPADQPLASVSVQPTPGWRVTTAKRTLDPPIKTDDGEVTQAVTQIDWTATSTDGGIKPGQFQQFLVSVGPLPEAKVMVFKAIQRYSDGSQVAWIEQAAAGTTAEPEHPAPTLSLAPSPGPSSGTAAAASGSDDAPSRGAVTVATVLGGAGLVCGLGALAIALANRRRPAS